MAEPVVPPSPSRVRVPDSPLHPSQPLRGESDRASVGHSSPRTAIQEYEQDDDGDDLAYAAAPAASQLFSKSHRPRPSTSRLLPDDEDVEVPGSPVSPQMRERQRRLRSYEDEDGPEASVGCLGRLWRPLKGMRAFVKKNEGLLLIALSQVFFAMINACVKLLESEIAVPVWELIAVRMIFTFAGCYIYLRWSGDPHPLLGPPGVRLLLCARGVVGFFGLFPGYYALQYLSLSDATTISFLSPVLVGLFAWILLKEPYSLLEAFVGCTSLLGTVFIAKPTFLFPPPSNLPPDSPSPLPDHEVSSEQRTAAVGVALIGVVGAAGAYLIIRTIGKRASALHSISYFSLYSVVVSCFYPLIFDAPPVFHLDKRFFALLLPIGIFGFIAQTLLTMGLQREKAGRGTLAVYTNLIFAMILERIIFHKLPDAWSILGALIIVGGAIRVALEKKKVPASSLAAGEAAPASEDRRKAQNEADKAEQGRGLRLVLEDESEEEDDEQEAGSSGIAAARGLDAER
ncbi:hypothetical protein JCM1840_005369 [Sporobolomyces johnsonii]